MAMLPAQGSSPVLSILLFLSSCLLLIALRLYLPRSAPIPSNLCLSVFVLTSLFGDHRLQGGEESYISFVPSLKAHMDPVGAIGRYLWMLYVHGSIEFPLPMGEERLGMGEGGSEDEGEGGVEEGGQEQEGGGEEGDGGEGQEEGGQEGGDEEGTWEPDLFGNEWTEEDREAYKKWWVSNVLRKDGGLQLPALLPLSAWLLVATARLAAARLLGCHGCHCCPPATACLVTRLHDIALCRQEQSLFVGKGKTGKIAYTTVNSRCGMACSYVSQLYA